MRVSSFSSLLTPHSLLNILDLFPHLLDEDLQLHRHLGHGDVDRLRAQRIGFPVQFLHQEIQSLSDRAAFFENALEFRDVRREPAQLLIDIDLVREQRDTRVDRAPVRVVTLDTNCSRRPCEAILADIAACLAEQGTKLAADA